MCLLASSAVHDDYSSEAVLDLQIEQRRAQRFAVGIERERPRHAAAERPVITKFSADMLGSS